jgi:hypothetical protein
LAADPLRLSAGGAEPKPAMSDVLCRLAVLPQELRLPRSRRGISSCDGMTDLPPRQHQSHAVWLGMTRTLTQDAFGRIELSLAGWSRASWRFLDVHAWSSNTLLCVAINPPWSGDRVVAQDYSLSPQLTLRWAFGGTEKIFLTDVCNRLTIRASADRSIPERAAFAERAARCPE